MLCPQLSRPAAPRGGRRGPHAGPQHAGPRRLRVAPARCLHGMDRGWPQSEKHCTDDDAVKESSRKYRRTVFDFKAWEAHRSEMRYNRHLMGMLSSRMVRGLARPLSYVLATSTAVVTYESMRNAGLLPNVLPHGVEWPLVQVDSPHLVNFTSFALSLLLVFRTNSSYSRWLDARKAWGLLLNRSRDLARQGLTYIPRADVELRGLLCRWVPAFSRALMCHLRKEQNFEEELAKVLLPSELEQVMMAEHKPSFILQVLSEAVRESGAQPTAQLAMDQNLSTFEDVMGTCERILKTPIPLSYTRHTSRFLVIWLTLLPFTLFGALGLATAPLCLLIAFLLLGIEEIGVSIEEPFSILALEAICDSAANNVRELYDRYLSEQQADFAVSGTAAAAASGGPPRVRRLSPAAIVAARGGAPGPGAAAPALGAPSVVPAVGARAAVAAAAAAAIAVADPAVSSSSSSDGGAVRAASPDGRVHKSQR